VRPRPLLKRLYSCIRRGFSTPKKSGDAKWYSLQTIWVRDEIYWRRSIHPKCATRRAPSLDRGSSAAGRAALQWMWRGHLVSGGSTLSMQVARLIAVPIHARGCEFSNQPRRTGPLDA
jgi:hypothetical protein